MMVCVIADELDVPITVDEYTKQLRELQHIHFPEAELMPGIRANFQVLFITKITRHCDL